jgi:hypothetical protein
MNGIIVWSPGVSLEAVEKQVIQRAIDHYRGNKTATAGALLEFQSGRLINGSSATTKTKKQRTPPVKETNTLEMPSSLAPEESNPPNVLKFDPNRRLKPRLAALKLREGFDWNPLLTLPPNRPCPCLSGLKFKRCCRRRLPRVVREDVAKAYRAEMAKPDLIFRTPENADKILDAVRAKDAELKAAAECKVPTST